MHAEGNIKTKGLIIPLILDNGYINIFRIFLLHKKKLFHFPIMYPVDNLYLLSQYFKTQKMSPYRIDYYKLKS